MPQTTSLLRYEPITIHPLPASYFKFFCPLCFKTCFFLGCVVYNNKKLVCFTPGIKFFLKQFEYLLVSLKVELRRIPYMTYKKSVSLTSVFPPLIRPVDLPIHLKRLLTVIIEKNNFIETTKARIYPRKKY